MEIKSTLWFLDKLFRKKNYINNLSIISHYYVYMYIFLL